MPPQSKHDLLPASLSAHFAFHSGYHRCLPSYFSGCQALVIPHIPPPLPTPLIPWLMTSPKCRICCACAPFLDASCPMRDRNTAVCPAKGRVSLTPSPQELTPFRSCGTRSATTYEERSETNATESVLAAGSHHARPKRQSKGVAAVQQWWRGGSSALPTPRRCRCGTLFPKDVFHRSKVRAKGTLYRTHTGTYACAQRKPTVASTFMAGLCRRLTRIAASARLGSQRRCRRMMPKRACLKPTSARNCPHRDVYVAAPPKTEN